MPKLAMDFSRTVIYKIINRATGEVLYIGSTTNFNQRKREHKTYTNSNQVQSNKYSFKIYQDIRILGGWEQVDMIMVEEYKDCTSNLEKLKREREWYDKLMPICNMIRPSVTIDETKHINAEYKMAYREANRDTINEKAKRYYEANKDAIKEYREANKDIMRRKRKEYNEVNRHKINQYAKTYHAANKDIINQKGKEYRATKKAAKQAVAETVV